MNVYLVQHGIALDKSVDPERGLSEEGMRQLDLMGVFLSATPLRIPHIWHSGKKRALQTADILAKCVGGDKALEEHGGLGPMNDVVPMAETLAGLSEDTMLVGHLPFMSKLAGLLLAGDADREVVNFRNAGVVCLSRDEAGSWHVQWHVTQDLLGA
jgi:phosphohistidine phosphatase